MTIKLLELRDKATFIPIFAFRAQPTEGNEPERYLLSRAGFGASGDSDLVIVGRLNCSPDVQSCAYAPYQWLGRTFPAAHKYIQEHFDSLSDGQVIDVEYILGETSEEKKSEREEVAA